MVVNSPNSLTFLFNFQVISYNKFCLLWDLKDLGKSFKTLKLFIKWQSSQSGPNVKAAFKTMNEKSLFAITNKCMLTAQITKDQHISS